MKFVIEIPKNGRLFFLTECENESKYTLTWLKEYAKIFDSEDDAKNFIKGDSGNITLEYYKIIDYSLAKNH